MSETPHLESRTQDAIVRLYETFEVPTPKVIEGCPCCLDTRRVDTLLAKPLRELTGDDLWRYVTGVFYTVGSPTDFRYLLPRIMELAIDGGSLPDTEIILNKLGLASWEDWSSDEKAAINELLSCWLDLSIAHDIEFDFALRKTESFLCGAALAGIPADRWRHRLAGADAKPVLEELDERNSRLWSAFWEDAPDEKEALRELVQSLREASSLNSEA